MFKSTSRTFNESRDDDTWENDETELYWLIEEVDDGVACWDGGGLVSDDEVEVATGAVNCGVDGSSIELFFASIMFFFFYFLKLSIINGWP